MVSMTHNKYKGYIMSSTDYFKEQTPRVQDCILAGIELGDCEEIVKWTNDY